MDEFQYLAGITSYGGSFDRTCEFRPAVYKKLRISSDGYDAPRWNMWKNQKHEVSRLQILVKF